MANQPAFPGSGALVAMNPTKWCIQALMDGFDFTAKQFLIHVMQAKRQTGSSL